MSVSDDPFGGMDQPCPRCERVVGDHTLREFRACQVARGEVEDRPYRELRPEDRVAAVIDGVRQSFGIGGDVLVADHVTCKALVLVGEAGAVTVRSPAVQMEFRVGLPTGPAVVTKVLYLTPTSEDARRFGKLVRDTSNGAANAAERARQDPAWRPGR